MALTAKHKELLSRAEKRTKDLNDFISERGDNITAADLVEAHKIRDELKGIRAEIDVCVQADELRGNADEMNKFLNAPAGQHRHDGTKIVGGKRDGDTTIARGSKGKAFRILRQSGAGTFGEKAFEAISGQEYRQAVAALFRGRATSKHFRTLEEGLDPQGGYLSPLDVQARLIQRKPTPTRVAGMVDVVNTSRDAISLPRVNYSSASDDTNGIIYTTGFRATATDENPTSDTQALVADSNLFGSIRVPNFTWMIEGVLTNNQVEDAMFDPMAWMAEKFGETIELLKDNMILNGNGVVQPSGILVNPGGGGSFTSGATNDVNQPIVIATGNGASPWFTPDSIIDTSEDLPEQYDENCCWVYQKTSTGKFIRKLKDNQGRYLWGMGYQDSGLELRQRKVLNGYPAVYSQFMPAPAATGAGQWPVIFGDLKGYTMVNRIGFSFQVLREVAARRNQVIILGRVRFGGLLLEPWRIRVMQVHA